MKILAGIHLQLVFVATASKMLNSERNDEVSDTTGDYSSNAAGKK